MGAGRSGGYLLMVKGSARDLISRIERKAPEYLDLLSAQTEAEFDEAVDAVLSQGVAFLEKNKKLYKGMNEEGLSSVLVARMTIPGLTVTQEEYSNGHVDLTISADHSNPIRKKLCEAKIY